MNDLRSKLPESFGVTLDDLNPRWKECIKLMNEIFDGCAEGSSYRYYGIDINGDYDYWDSADHFDQIITIEEFFKLIEEPANITNYQIY